MYMVYKINNRQIKKSPDTELSLKGIPDSYSYGSILRDSESSLIPCNFMMKTMVINKIKYKTKQPDSISGS
uniref:Uncharacterized protein n=1 Tax=Rhizophora mucronata TaxID=61149 RepID=A0A2P2JZR7_RHIMU